jgi:hypothetical protein
MAQDKRQKEFYDVPEEPVTEGVIMEGVLSHYVSPKTAISYAENMHNDSVGMMTSRRPLVSRVTPVTEPKSCTLFQNQSASDLIVWQDNTTMKYNSVFGGSNVDITTVNVSVTQKVRYETVLGYLCYTTGTGQPAYWDGATVAAARFGTTLPTSIFDLISFYGGYLWFADDTAINNRLYYTDPLPSTFPTGVTGAGAAQYLTVNAPNGDRITGFASTQNLLYVFCHNSIFRVSSPTSIDNSPIAQVGVFTQEAIVRTKTGFFFFHPSGVFQLTEGGTPKEVSIKIRDIIQSIPVANQADVFGWSDEDHIYFSIGKGLNGYQVDKSYIIRYTISTQVWTIYSTLGFISTCASDRLFSSTVASSEDYFPTNFIFGTTLTTAGAKTSTFLGGTFNVFTQSTENSGVTSDWGSIPISVEFQSNWLNFGIEEHAKRANGLFIPSENGTGLKVAYKIDSDLPNVWREIGTIGGEYVTSFNSWQSDNFHRIKFRVYGQTNGRTVKVGNPKIRVLDDLGYDSN